METTKDLHLTAIHEVGSYMAATRLGMPATGPSIIPNPGKGTMGHFATEEQGGSQDAAADKIMVLCSGFAAVISAGFNKEYAEQACWDDFDKASELISDWNLGSLDEHKREAVTLMSTPETVVALTR